jgi:hypothetical protein
MLRAADLEPASLPAQAILCIRRLPDPLPGTIDLSGHASVPPAPWQRAARESIENLARRAARPAVECVPAAAEAVLFLDRAEMLACAALDAVRGTLAHEWWWPRLVDVHAGLAPIIREWTREPRCVPAVMAMLARRRADVVAVARSMARDDARRLVELVLREHALPSAAQAIVAELTTRREEPVLSRQQPSPKPQWLELVPEAGEPSLAVEQRLVIAVPLLLQRAPALVRAKSFETAIVRWIAAQTTTTASRTNANRGRERTPPPRSRTLTGAAPVEPPRARAMTSAAPPTSAKTIAPRAKQPTAPSASRITVKSRSRTTIADRSQIEPHRQHTTSVEAQLATPTRVHDEIAASTPEIAPLPDLDFHSDFAGALFLFNAGIALGFYSDFTSPAQQGIGLDIFLFADRLGRALAGRKFTRDPVHAFLKRRTARWTPPPVLAAYPNAPRRNRWIAAVANHLRLRLGAKLARQLVSVPGRITASLLHLDAYFSLAVHPIEIRIAGLDRNPGWIPAAGRHVAFHFD